MKSFAVFLIAGALAFGLPVEAANPVGKVIQLLGDLETKVVKEGQEAEKTYNEYSEWCEDRSKNVAFEIKTGKAEVEQQTAIIESETSNIASLNAKIEELANGLTVDGADLKAATAIRKQEAADFTAEERELVETVSTLERAILILEKEMRKGGALLQQLNAAGGNLAQAFNTLVDASMLGSADAAKLTALVQQHDSDDDDDEQTGAPAAAVYEGHSGSIIETLENLLDKAKGALEKARGKETNSLHNFEMLKQSLEDEIKFAEKDMAEAKKSLAASKEAKAGAEGDLKVASDGLAEDEDTLSTLHQDCLERAQDYEAAKKSREEELKALREAKAVLSESTAGADTVVYEGPVSLLQLSGSTASVGSNLRSGADLANFEAVRFVRQLARKMHSEALTQLAARMAYAIRGASHDGADPFAKVKELIKDMIERLLGEANADASHKAYCDKELGTSAESKAEKTATIEKLTAKIDSMSARSAQLKEETAVLQKELADLASAQAEMTEIRNKEHAAFVANKAEVEEGLQGVKQAMAILRDYYAQEDKDHEAALGAGQSIIGLLEVVESDFTKSLAEMTVGEQSAVTDYERETQANKIATATKQQDVKYKTKEAASLDKAVSEATSDRAGVQEELDALMQYIGKLDSICIAKPETYEERKARRTAEIEGLKEALSILAGESLLQRRATLRGVRRHG